MHTLSVLPPSLTVSSLWKSPVQSLSHLSPVITAAEIILKLHFSPSQAAGITGKVAPAISTHAIIQKVHVVVSFIWFVISLTIKRSESSDKSGWGSDMNERKDFYKIKTKPANFWTGAGLETNYKGKQRCMNVIKCKWKCIRSHLGFILESCGKRCPYVHRQQLYYVSNHLWNQFKWYQPVTVCLTPGLIPGFP